MSALAHQVFVTGQIPQSGPLPDGSRRLRGAASQVRGF